MPDKRASATLSKIDQALEDDQTSAISAVIRIIQELAGRAFSISISDLSELIGRDPTLTAKIISAANTLGLNPSGIQIRTISGAIHTVGFEQIRNLALSLLLAENAGKDENGFEQREVAAASVCSGMIAQTLLRENESSVDAEIAFVCCSLRHYGKLLLSTFLVEQFREARALALEMPEAEAFRQVFGISPLALSRHYLQRANLPMSITTSMREAGEEMLQRGARSKRERVVLLAEWSADVCAVAFDELIQPDAFNDALQATLDKFQASFPISLDRVHHTLALVENNIGQLNRLLGVKDKDSPATLKLRARLSGRALTLPPEASRIAPRPRPKSFHEMSHDEKESFIESTFQEAITHIDEKLLPGERVNAQEIYQTASQCILESFDLENCLIFVPEDVDSHCLSARFGHGPLYEKFKNRPLISSKNKDVFSICLNRKEDVLIQDTQAGKIRSVVPDWIHAKGETTSFVVLPTTFNAELFAIIVGTVSGHRSIQLAKNDLRRLRIIRARLTTFQKMIQERSVTLI